MVLTLNGDDYGVAADVTFDAYVNFTLSLRDAVGEHLRLRHGGSFREIDSNEVNEPLKVIRPLRHGCGRVVLALNTRIWFPP